MFQTYTLTHNNASIKFTYGKTFVMDYEEYTFVFFYHLFYVIYIMLLLFNHIKFFLKCKLPLFA